MVHGQSWENCNNMIEGVLDDALRSLTVAQKELVGLKCKSAYNSLNEWAKIMCTLSDLNEFNQLERN
jgi:hypothetical protein